jgi:hypothetical protein
MVGSGMEAGLDGAALLEFFAAHGSLANTHAAQQPQPTNAYPPAQPGAAQHTPQVSAPAELDASAMCAVVVAFLQQQTNSKAQDRSSSGEGAAGMVNGSDGGSDASGFHPAAAAAGVAAGTGLQQHDSQQLVG